MKIIEIRNLIKIYHNFKIAIKHFIFDSGKGYLLLGENGSGKSTIIKLILSLIKPTDGEVILYTKKIGFIPEHFSLPPLLTISRFLNHLCALKNINNKHRVNELITLWKLDQNKKIMHLSKGMKQKVNILQALIDDVDLYIFDEPLSGLDQDSQSLLLDVIDNLLKKQKTIIITSHYQKYFQKLNLIEIIIEHGKIYEKLN